MKNIMTALAMTSVIGLTACGEKDTREDHIFTVEAEITDTKGNIQKIKEDCPHMEVCMPGFKLTTPNGEKRFQVAVKNEPKESDAAKLFAKLSTAKNKEDEKKITMPEYEQKVWVFSIEERLKKTKDLSVRWKPKSERKESIEMVSNDGTKLADVKVRVY